MSSNNEIILHHYPASPYSEKARLFLGYKQVSWLSVLMPSTLPKPELIPLTGGYRRAPVLQIGSDIYCDTAIILEKIHSIFPEPPISTGEDAEQAELLGYLVDSEIFIKVARFVMGSYAQKLPQELVEDRAKMHPMFEFTREMLEKDVEYLRVILSKYLPKFNFALLSSPYFGGKIPAYADFGIYIVFWFLNTIRKFKPMVGERAQLVDWFSRMKNFGSGMSTSISAQDALKIAQNSEPISLGAASIGDPNFQPGQAVLVSPEFYDQETIAGSIIHLDSSEIILSSENEIVGRVHIHFPRIGYSIRPA